MAVLYNSVHFTLLILLLRAKVDDQISWACQICQYFLLRKYENLLHCKSFSHFFNKNIRVFGYEVVKHLTS